MKRVFLAHTALFIVNLIYALNYTIAKDVMPNYIEPSGFILSTPVIEFWIFKIIFVREKVQRKDLFLMALCGLFGVAMNQLFFFHGLSLTSPVNAAIIMTLILF